MKLQCNIINENLLILFGNGTNQTFCGDDFVKCRSIKCCAPRTCIVLYAIVLQKKKKNPKKCIEKENGFVVIKSREWQGVGGRRKVYKGDQNVQTSRFVDKSVLGIYGTT